MIRKRMEGFGTLEKGALQKALQLQIESKRMSWHVEQLKAEMTALVDFLNRSLDISFDPNDSPEGEQDLFKQMRNRYRKAIIRACKYGNDNEINKILEEALWPPDRQYSSEPPGAAKYFFHVQRLIRDYRQLMNGTIYWTDVRVCGWEKCSKFFYLWEKGKRPTRKFCSIKCQKAFNNLQKPKNSERRRVADTINDSFDREVNRLSEQLYKKYPDESDINDQMVDMVINKAKSNIKKRYEKELNEFEIDITKWGLRLKERIKHGQSKR